MIGGEIRGEATFRKAEKSRHTTHMSFCAFTRAIGNMIGVPTYDTFPDLSFILNFIYL